MSKYYDVKVIFGFTEKDLKTAKRWWKSNNFSDEENDGMILVSAALEGIIEADINEDAKIINEEDYLEE